MFNNSRRASKRILPCLVFMFYCDYSCAEPVSLAAPAKGISYQTVPKIGLKQVFDRIKFNKIVYMLQAPNDNSSWYIVEKQGRVLKVANQQSTDQSKVFIDITDRVDAQPNEAGLLGMAFDPQYAANHQVYLSYTNGSNNLVSRISRFRLLKNGDALDPGSEQIILQVDQPYSNHNGGNIQFGPDGYLYIGLGDGGAGGDPHANGQNTNTLLGALLRIDIRAHPYGIPSDNPFANGHNGRPEIYAWGLRNPWRWSFDRKTHTLWLADVGQNAWEEVNRITQAGNFGWNRKEASHCYKASSCVQPNLVEPVIEYSHDNGCSITGGYVYRGVKLADLQGVYLFADYCSGAIWGARELGAKVTQPQRLMNSGLNIASFAQGNDGELFVIHLGGEIYQITP